MNIYVLAIVQLSGE